MRQLRCLNHLGVRSDGNRAAQLGDVYGAGWRHKAAKWLWGDTKEVEVTEHEEKHQHQRKFTAETSDERAKLTDMVLALSHSSSGQTPPDLTKLSLITKIHIIGLPVPAPSCCQAPRSKLSLSLPQPHQLTSPPEQHLVLLPPAQL